MSDLKKLAQSIGTSTEPRDVKELVNPTGNIYEALCVISKRSRQISIELKKELHEKLNEFASQNENLEEVMENKEQIEISRFYERLPNASLIATHEFLTNRLHYDSADTLEDTNVNA
jgi:DNA-directed RNA polymerase subunit K/omega